MPEVPEQKVLKRQCPACGLQLDAHCDRCPRDGTLVDNPLGDEPSFAGKYEYLGVIGKGGMGVIYKARQIIIDKLVAIKMIHPHLVSVDTADRFQLEAKAIGMLSHPFIVTLHDFGVSKSGQSYMIMDYVEGKTLDVVLARDGQLNKERFLRIFVQVCDALAHAHKRGVMHRDLKPSNIMLVRTEDRNEEVRIMDFGIAKLMNDTESNTKGLTKTGEAVGSPLYMSPEQSQGHKIDARTDLYSLGCVMYECLTGSPPFIGNSELDTILMHINAPPLSLKEASLGREFDPQVEAMVMKLLEKDPNDRYGSMAELSAALTAAQPELAPQAAAKRAADQIRRPVGTRSEKVAKAQKRNPVPYVVAGIAVVALGAGGLVFMTNSHKPTAQPAVSASSPAPAQPNPAGENASVDQDVASGDVFGLVRVAAEQEDPVLNLEVSRPVVGNARVTKETLTCFAPEKKNGKLSADALSIKAIKMPDFQVTDDVLEVLTPVPLTGLDVSGNPLKDVHALAKMPTLERLDLARTNINSEGMVNIGKLNKLEAIDLSGTQITNEELKQLYGLKALKEVRISNCANIKGDALKQLRDRTKCQITQGGRHTEFIPMAQIEASMEARNWDKAVKQIDQMLEREESALVQDYGTIALLYQKLGSCFDQQSRIGTVTPKEAKVSMEKSEAAFEKATKILAQHFPDSSKVPQVLANAAEVFEGHNRDAIGSSADPQLEMKSQAVRQRYLRAIAWRNQADRIIDRHSTNGHLVDLIPANESHLGEDYSAVGDDARALAVFTRTKNYWDPATITRPKDRGEAQLARATLDVLIANAYFNQNKTAEGLRLYEQTRKLMPKIENDENRASLNKLRWNAAQAYEKLNRPADAEEALLGLEAPPGLDTVNSVHQHLAEVDLLIRVAAEQKKTAAVAEYNQQRADLTKRLEELEEFSKAKPPSKT